MRSRPPSRNRQWAGGALAAALAAAVVAVGGAGAAEPTPPESVPAYYLTAQSTDDLENQAHDTAARFAKTQGDAHAVMILDFGAARKKGDDYGTALRSGTFFTNDEIADALQAAAKGYDEADEQGSVTIVYANSNSDLGNPGKGYEAFSEDIAKEAGEEQAKAIAGLSAPSNVAFALGGDIEPGFEGKAPPSVPIAMVEGAIDEGNGTPYYDIGTAPCGETKCDGGWTVKDLCSVVAGESRHPLPEIYFAYQAAGWTNVANECNIKRFAGASASHLGTLDPERSWTLLGQRSGATVGPVLVGFPG